MSVGIATTVIYWIFGCMAWIPVEVLYMLILIVLVKFADSVLGLWDRAMRLIGR